MNRKIGTLSTIAALLVGGSAVVVQVVQAEALPGDIEIPAGNVGYVNAGGNALKTGLGECLKMGLFSDDSVVNACEGIDDTAAAEEAADAADEDAAAAESPTPAPEPVAKEPIVTTATLGGEALFDSGSATLSSSSEQALAELVSQLEKFQEISAIRVTGHSDSTGPEAFNQTLSEQRAKSVEDFIKAAYPNVAVTSEGLGESSPVATNSTPEGRSLNRRVEVQVTAKSVIE
ncbi:MAG: OmpA family protein [Granulosicoccus sp.]